MLRQGLEPEVLSVRYTLLYKGATPPLRSTEGAAGYDLYAARAYLVHRQVQPVMIDTGVAFAIPEGWVGLIRDRSGMAAIGLWVVGGVIDSDYRGEVKVMMHTMKDQPQPIAYGQRVAQILFVPTYAADLVCVDHLEPTARGTRGFGSTGK